MYLKQLLIVGKRYEFSEVASFVRILQSDMQSALRITFYRQGREIDTVENVGRGYAERFEGEPFDKIAFSTIADQNVEIVVRLSQTCTYDTPPVGDVNVNNFPANQIVTVSNPDAQKQYIQYGASYKSNAALAANSPETVFTAAANVRGAIVHRASLSSFRSAGPVSGMVLIAKATPPANTLDGDVIVGCDCGGISANYFWAGGRLEEQIFITPGKGLFAVVDGAENAGHRSALYTLL